MSRSGRVRGNTGTRGRALPAAALGCLFALVSAACSGGPGGTAPPGKDAGASDRGPIVVASGLDVTGSGGVRQQLIEEWNRRHAGSEAEQAKLVELPGGADQQRSQLLGALQSGSAGYDVVNLDITWIPEFAEAGLIRPVPADEPVDRDFINRVHRTTLWKGRSYARPFNTDVGLLFYRPDVLEDAGIQPSRQPTVNWTWRDLNASIKTLALSPRRGEDQAGWTTQLKQYEGLTVNAVEAFATAGVELADEDGSYTASEAELKKGLDELLARTHHERILPSAVSSDETATLADFAAGRVAFLRHWPYVYGALRTLLPPDAYSVNRLPGTSVLGGQNLAVASDSPRAGNARALIEFLTSQESEQCLLDAGFAATRASVYNSSSRRCWPRVAATLRPAQGAPRPPAVRRPRRPPRRGRAARTTRGRWRGPRTPRP
ncbi:ABC transporter substrate-binding protein [Streptomyces fulvorobeus]|uniref:ABC transporter substrate-binding protein n=1 Tax=Streptomyces fulvorobeus TaxID=284028 RepID=A0A7J0C4C7_9ACTN|nr:extracellular solute-binding protein [Streptomyces fulvorobeus]GFM97362.1 ABC transporter substrate-binding protein [Streptomyces fulvorobeus]